MIDGANIRFCRGLRPYAKTYQVLSRPAQRGDPPGFPPSPLLVTVYIWLHTRTKKLLTERPEGGRLWLEANRRYVKSERVVDQERCGEE